MLDRIIAFSIKQKLIVGLLVLGLIAYGGYQVTQLPIDAVPDITNNQVQVLTVSPALGAGDIERLITFPIEQATVYDPFGRQLLESETVANRLEFNGLYGVEEVGGGLSFMRARFYDPGQGRFIVEDPLWLNGDAQNLYRFAGNLPATLLDPMGLLTYSVGVGGDAYLPYPGGLSLGAGVYFDEDTGDYGLYLMGGWGIGLQLGAGVDFGAYTNKDVFGGAGFGFEAEIGVVSAGASTSMYKTSDGKLGLGGAALQIGVGPGVGAHVGFDYTGVFSIKSAVDWIPTLGGDALNGVVEAFDSLLGFSDGGPHSPPSSDEPSQ